MQYIKKDLGSFNLHMIKTDKFKTITARVVFHSPIIKEEITKRLALSEILLQSSYNYPSRRDLTIKAEELYSADVYGNTQRIGNYINTSFTISVLNDKYTEENNMEKAIEFISDIILNPNVNNKSFNNEKLDIVKNNLKVSIDSIKEDPTEYSLIRMGESYDKTSPISYRMIGYSEDLDNINVNNLYEFYEKVIKNDYIDIFVIGNFDMKDMLQIIKKYFKFRTIKKKKASYELKPKKCRSRRLLAKETINNSQSKLAIACPINKLTSYEKQYVLPLANIIYGGGVDSRLFKQVREENSLCYSIHSSTRVLDSLLVVHAGIDKDNYKTTLKLVTKILEELKRGKITEKDIETAKELYKTSIDSIEDYEFQVLNEYFKEEVLSLDNYKDRYKNINKVKKSEIIKVFRKINMDTVFLLEGVEE